MLRNRSRAVTSKQTLMADHSSSQSSPTQNLTKQIPSFFGSPRFKAFTCSTEMSPNSILDTKQFLPFGYYDINHPKSPRVLFPEIKQQHSWEKQDAKGVGLALIDKVVNEEKSTHEASNRKVLFGTKLRVQIPPLLPPASTLVSPSESPCSPNDFGIKTRNSHLLPEFGSPNSGNQTNGNSPRIFTGCLTVSEMELSEDYTCVISHGPNPKTTHIFDNCIVESYCYVSAQPVPTDSFLSFCYTCKKNLEHKNDIYIYRGEKAFCSQECRYQEMLSDGLEK